MRILVMLSKYNFHLGGGCFEQSNLPTGGKNLSQLLVEGTANRFTCVESGTYPK